MASKRRLHNETTVRELFLISDSDTSATPSNSDTTHKSESYSDSDNDVDRQMEKSQWTASTYCADGT
jgi:hypothetical protein